MPNRDLILLETVKTHRARLVSAFVYGEQAERRVTNDNVRRLLGGVVLAAVVCAGCVGFSFVAALLGQQAATARQQAGEGPATGTVFAADAFDRSTDSGWGTAERGGDWRTSDPADAYRVAAGAGLLQVVPGTVRTGYLADSLQDRSDVTYTLQRPTEARTGTVEVDLLGRRVSSSQDYRALVALRPDGSVALTLARVSAASTSEPRENLSDTVILFQGLQLDPNSPPPSVSVRLQVIGTNATTLRVKAWSAGGAEPSEWNLQASDSTADLQRPGTVGLDATVSGTDQPAVLAVLDLVGREAP